MKLKFNYHFKDTCYNTICFENQRVQEEEVINEKEFKLSPCQKTIKILILEKNKIILVFPSGKKVKITNDIVSFSYSEFYELFEDARYYELEGTIKLIEE